jgi:molybdenum cofactor cytidylyltransferase
LTDTPQVGAIVLAAGLSRRMGGPKLAMEMNGVPILARTLAAVEDAGLPLRLVVGGHADAVRAVAPGVPLVHAPAFARGLAESLKAGLAAAPASWSAALVVLADMPFVQPATLRTLAAALAAGAPAVVPVQAGARGNPAGFARAAWPALLQLSGDQGARRLLDSLGAAEVPVDDAGIHRDIDRPADLLSGVPAPPSAR